MGTSVLTPSAVSDNMTTLKACILLVLATVCASRPSPDTPHHSPVYKHDPIPYSFEYAVQDKYHGVDFGQNEHSDGKSVKGSYQVQLPDGRKQTVKYDADHHKGYTAQVEYYGEAQYPHEYGPAVTFKPSAYKPKPTYH